MANLLHTRERETLQEMLPDLGFDHWQRPLNEIPVDRGHHAPQPRECVGGLATAAHPCRSLLPAGA